MFIGCVFSVETIWVGKKFIKNETHLLMSHLMNMFVLNIFYFQSDESLYPNFPRFENLNWYLKFRQYNRNLQIQGMYP